MYEPHDPHTEIMAPVKQTKLAYTLNNDQPVRCTYISEEPLFYLDANINEEEFMDDALLFELGLHPQQTQEVLDADLRELTADEALNTEKLFAEQFGLVDGPVQTNLVDTVQLLKNSRMATALLEFAFDHGVRIEVTQQTEVAFYDRHKSVISLRPLLTETDQALLLVRELRRVWQHRNGTLLHPLLFHPDQAIVINRVQAADLMTIMVRVAWELKLSGQRAVWCALEAGDNHDLARAFAREALTDFRAINNGRAMAAVFESWFMSERCRSYDRKLIQEMLSDYQGYVSKAGESEPSRVLTQQILSTLGSVPFGKNYLSAHAATIMADPMFTDIRDRSNANFLWFIKFEQSFRQTEKTLMDVQEKLDEEVLSPMGEVLSFPAYAAPQTDRKIQVNGSGSVVDIGHYRETRGLI
jgi:hypothetical protein